MLFVMTSPVSNLDNPLPPSTLACVTFFLSFQPRSRDTFLAHFLATLRLLSPTTGLRNPLCLLTHLPNADKRPVLPGDFSPFIAWLSERTVNGEDLLALYSPVAALAVSLMVLPPPLLVG